MNISYNWLKEYIQFDLSPQETADALTSIGLEAGSVEEIQSIRGGLEGLVIGEVLTCEPHPGSDHLSLTTVNVGGEEALKIVCGAPNVAKGQKVVVATIGTKIYFGDNEVTIKRSKIRGEESHGMICSEDEIGIGKASDGIIVLPEDAQVGMTAKEYYNIKSDYVFEIDITPNRVDGTSHYGVARDLAAYLKQANIEHKLIKPSVEDFVIDKKDGGIDVVVENNEACPRYSGLTMRNVEVKESPDWLKNKLLLIGLRPINNIVDITNFVLHETGHPMHAFDAKYITGNKVVVKTLPAGTKFTTLDQEERELHENDLMICNNNNEGMCIAGVFGGDKSGVTETTTDVFLESAYFNPTWVRKAARRNGLNTDSSFRFERGVDPNNTIYVLKRAALLIKELAGGTIEGDIRDIYPTPIEKPSVTLSYEKANKLIGKEIDKATVKNILESLEIEIESETDTELTLRIPTYRVDVLRDVDVIEEVLRIYGYNNIEFSNSVKSNLSYQTETDNKYKLQTLISEQLTAAGFYEIMNNSLTSRSYYENNEVYPINRSVSILNQLSNDLGVMRQTLLYGGLESIAYNRNRKHNDLRLYEFGNCYTYNIDKKRDNNVLAEYSEDTRIGLWICGKTTRKNWATNEADSSVFELKAAIENILKRIGIGYKQVVFETLESPIYSSGMTIRSHKRNIGSFGIVSSRVLRDFDIDTEVYYAEMSWDVLMKEIKSNKVKFSEISKFPAVSRDLALLLDKNINFDEIEKIAMKSERKLLKQVSLFDVYEGKNLPEGKKSYAVNFMLQDESKTLTDKQIDAVMKKIQHNLEKELNASLR